MNLNDILKTIDCKKDVPFEGTGIILLDPVDKKFYKIAFGDGTNADSLEDDCDDYMYLQIDEYDKDGNFNEDVDGGQMDIRRKDYTGFINDYNLIFDCLNFLDCKNLNSLVLVRKFKA